MQILDFQDAGLGEIDSPFFPKTKNEWVISSLYANTIKIIAGPESDQSGVSIGQTNGLFYDGAEGQSGNNPLIINKNLYTAFGIEYIPYANPDYEIALDVFRLDQNNLLFSVGSVVQKLQNIRKNRQFIGCYYPSGISAIGINTVNRLVQGTIVKVVPLGNSIGHNPMWDTLHKITILDGRPWPWHQVINGPVIVWSS